MRQKNMREIEGKIYETHCLSKEAIGELCEIIQHTTDKELMKYISRSFELLFDINSNCKEIFDKFEEISLAYEEEIDYLQELEAKRIMEVKGKCTG